MNINESPDSIMINGITKSWDSSDAVCFSMIDDITIYDDRGKAAPHNFLVAGLFHIFQNGDKGIKELESNGVTIKGSMTNNSIHQLKNLFDVISSGKGGFKRDKSMRLAPNLIHGRLWKQNPKVVSFWNPMVILNRLKKDIVDFVKIFDDPNNFVYDTDKGILSFEEFMGPGVSRESKFFDASKIHTMTPGPERKFFQMQNMGNAKFGSRSPKYPDVRTRSLISTSESFKDWLYFNERKIVE